MITSYTNFGIHTFIPPDYYHCLLNAVICYSEGKKWTPVSLRRFPSLCRLLGGLIFWWGWGESAHRENNCQNGGGLLPVHSDRLDQTLVQHSLRFVAPALVQLLFCTPFATLCLFLYFSIRRFWLKTGAGFMIRVTVCFSSLAVAKT